MSFNMSFDARTVAPNVGLDPVPTGEYDVKIVSTEEKLVKDGNGKAFIEIGMEIISGDYKGRKIFDRLNHKNPDEQTRNIAYGTLSALCYVTGIMAIQQSSAELHDKPFRAMVAKVPRDDDATKDTNRIRGYKDSQGYKPGENPGVAGATGGAAAAGWGGAPQATQAQPEQTQAWQAQPQATQVQPQVTQVQPQPQVQPQVQQTVAIDPRVLQLLQQGVPFEAAQTAIAAQDAAVAAATAAAQPQVQTTTAPASSGLSPADISARAAALVQSSMAGGTPQAQPQTQATEAPSNPPGVDETPEWAKPQG